MIDGKGNTPFDYEVDAQGTPGLTVNGKAEAVVLDAVFYGEVAEHLETVASIRRGLEQAKKGLGRSVNEVFDDLEREA